MKKETLTAWIQKHKRVIKAAVMALLPLLCCLFTCALEGKSLGDVYLPASEWNDELIYYKQVEGILEFGYPQGYFGFNESHSRLFSFAAWSPILVWPWILWGLIFGWNLMSPFYCNIAILSLAVFLFVWFAKPTKKQMGILSVLFVSFVPFTRYMLCGMPEIICFSMVIVVLGLGINYLEKESVGKLIALFALTSLMTLMRPYLIVFMVLPVFLWIRKKKWWGVIGSLAVLGITLFAYLLIKRYFSAEYFQPLFKTEWVDAFKNGGLFAGAKFLIYQLLVKGKEFFGSIMEAFRRGMPVGAHFAAFTLVWGILVVQSISDFLKKKKKELTINGYLVLCFTAMFAAVLVMYKLMEGSRHLVTFTVAGIFAISMMETKFYKKMILPAAIFVYLFMIHGQNYPYDFQIPYRNVQAEAELAEWQEIFGQELVTETDPETPNFDNVVVWTLYDYMLEDNTQVMTVWQPLYGLPAGFGINCCYPEYLVNNFDTLQSKYVVVPPGGTVEQCFDENGVVRLAETESLVLYKLR